MNTLNKRKMTKKCLKKKETNFKSLACFHIGKVKIIEVAHLNV